MSVTAEHFEDRLRQAEDVGLRNELGLESHEKECAIRYGYINENVSGIRNDLRKAAWTGAGIMLAILSFLVKLVFFA